MKTNAPTALVFMIAVILAVLSVVSKYVAIPVVSANAYWVMTAAFVVLAAGNLLKGL